MYPFVRTGRSRSIMVPLVVSRPLLSISAIIPLTKNCFRITAINNNVSFRYLAGDDGPKQSIAKKVTKKVRKSKKDGARSKDFQILLDCLDAPKIKLPIPDQQEEQRRKVLLRKYTIGKFKQHNSDNHDISCKLQLKKHAINMLPKGTTLKGKALTVDCDFPPRWRVIPAWTPSIKGFDPSEYEYLEE